MIAVVKHHMIGSLLMGMGGSEYVVVETAIALKKGGFDVYIDSFGLRRPEDLSAMAEFYGIPRSDIEGIGLGYPDEKPGLVVNASGDALSGSGDVVYLHYPSFIDVNSYYPALKGLVKAVGSAYSLLNGLLFPAVTRRAKLFIANSSLTAWFFNSVYGLKPEVVHPPVNLNGIADDPLPMRDRERVVLVVSRISPEKNLEKAVELGERLKEEGLGLKVVIAGSVSEFNAWYLKKIVNEISSRGLSEVVEVRVNLERGDLVKLYRTSLVYVHLTQMEHFGISIVEAAAAGTPVVVPRYSGAWIDVAEGDESVMAPYTTLDELVGRVAKLSSDHAYWAALSERGRRAALRYDRGRFHERLLDAIESRLGLSSNR